MDPKSELEKAVNAFMTYEDYLDSMLTKDDLMFLEDKDMCRDLLSMQYHSNKRIIPRGDFDQRKAEKAAQIVDYRIREPRICGDELTTSCKLMQALAKREKDNLNGVLATIIFIRDVNEKGEEVSSYIDYTHSLKKEDWKVYFTGEKKLAPCETDLRSSLQDHAPSLGSKDNHEIQTDEQVFRIDMKDTDYVQVVIFDHIVDRPIP
ncbi:cilia- and flagella-associated protein 299 [Nephila pilipes]|uniref:Cilia- and flagella-associated protein 299 n=1 Tax=Nephila pilipes TaxID=299642 RepID=A0A8X6IXC1_NEPPI|nr:cilia- and flagella-associated protein 299 [Nephila pilipes]